jgi:hypothetical protein
MEEEFFNVDFMASCAGAANSANTVVHQEQVNQPFYREGEWKTKKELLTETMRVLRPNWIWHPAVLPALSPFPLPPLWIDGAPYLENCDLISSIWVLILGDDEYV